MPKDIADASYDDRAPFSAHLGYAFAISGLALTQNITPMSVYEPDVYYSSDAVRPAMPRLAPQENDWLPTNYID